MNNGEENELNNEKVKVKVDVKSDTNIPTICPYCQSPVRLDDSRIIYGRSYGMVYVCARYPACDAFVGTHKGSIKPLGTLADGRLREMRKKAHASFDRLWLRSSDKKGEQYRKKESRGESYAWLANAMGLTIDKCHIGMMDFGQCLKVIDVCKKKMNDILD